MGSQLGDSDQQSNARANSVLLILLETLLNTVLVSEKTFLAMGTSSNSINSYF